MIKIKLLNYGNVGSLIAAFSQIDVYPTLVNSPGDAANADLLIFPGVGSAVNAHRFLTGPYGTVLANRNAAGKPILGICLGAQVMFEFLEESNSPGLGWINGAVRRFPPQIGFNNGWCHLDSDALADINLARSLRPDSTFYFNHQYYLPAGGATKIVPIRGYATVPALVTSGHLCAVQLHPEKSQRNGILLLRNILEDYYGF
jgi:glutamine amidotransferase